MEPDGPGTRFPVTMSQLRFGRLNPAKSDEAAAEIDTIARDLKVMSPLRAVSNLANPQPIKDPRIPVNRNATNAYDYFVTSSGVPVLSVVRELVEQSRHQQKPIRVIASPRPPTVSVRKMMPITVGAAIGAAVAYQWYPHYILTLGDEFHHGPLIWVASLMLFIVGGSVLLLDRLSGWAGWTEQKGGLLVCVVVVLLAAMGYWAWR